jgi:osmoprotectant transport system ATP-binding protein
MRRRMGYVIQQGGLFPHLTARQNVGLMAGYLGWRKAEIDARIRHLADLT